MMDYGTYPTPVPGATPAAKPPAIDLQQLMAMMQAQRQTPQTQQGGGFGGLGALGPLVGAGASAAGGASGGATAGSLAADSSMGAWAPEALGGGAAGASPAIALPIAASGAGLWKAGDPDLWKSGFLKTGLGKWNPYSTMVRGMGQSVRGVGDFFKRIF